MIFLAMTAGELGSETLTLSTFYPAPSGVYTKMITTSDTFLATTSGHVGIGTTLPIGVLDVKGTGDVLFNTSGNVGIGTTSPVATLDVAGSVKIGSGGQPCDSTHRGMLETYLNAGVHRLRYCDGVAWKNLTLVPQIVSNTFTGNIGTVFCPLGTQAISGGWNGWYFEKIVASHLDVNPATGQTGWTVNNDENVTHCSGALCQWQLYVLCL